MTYVGCSVASYVMISSVSTSQLDVTRNLHNGFAGRNHDFVTLRVDPHEANFIL